LSVATKEGRVEQATAAAGNNRWGTIRYALDSTARTLRLCLIMLVASVPPGLVALLIKRW
jgi:hypothetical protein